MNMTRRLQSLLGALLLATAAAGPAHAQATANPPERMTYQGFLVDANGLALGNNAPRNYDVVFRIWTAQTGGNRLWSEQQTVTVDKGFFNVLLGEGSAVSGEGRPVLSSVFTGTDVSDRFVSVTVKAPGLGSSDVEIAPRLRLMTAPYSFLARQAVSVVNAAGTPLVQGNGDALQLNVPVQSVGGDNRGTSATDLQVSRSAANQVASGNSSTISGGADNRASGATSTVGGGSGNLASGTSATVGGGVSNEATGNASTVPGGNDNTASGATSLAAGRRARATHNGALVWADSTDADFASQVDNEVALRASSGLRVAGTRPAAIDSRKQIIITDTTLNSANHALQLGYRFVPGVMAQGTIESVDNGNGSVLALQPRGGNVAIGKDTAPVSTLDVNGVVTATRFTGDGTIPIGGIIMWSGTVATIPSGWALCNGANGTPDLRDRFVLGAGGNYTPGTRGGNENIRLTVGQLPPHSHGYNDYYFSENFQGGGGWFGSGDSDWDNRPHGTDRTTASTGAGDAIDIRPQYHALAYIMRIR
jgi:hypothetical protein